MEFEYVFLETAEDYEAIANLEASIGAAIAVHKSRIMRDVMILNMWKVREGLWSFREWKKHAQQFTYSRHARAQWPWGHGRDGNLRQWIA